MNPLINLDDAWSKPEKAAEWRAKMAQDGTEASRQQGTNEEESHEP